MSPTFELSGRLVVTGHTADGRAAVVSDEVQPSTAIAVDGVSATFFWGHDDIPTFPDAGEKAPISGSQPPPGGCRFASLSIPSGANAAYHDFVVGALGLMAEPDRPGFHTTPTLDFILVTQGELELELEAGVTRRLRAGDTVVLNGVRHRWSNCGEGTATLVAAQIGARVE